MQVKRKDDPELVDQRRPDAKSDILIPPGRCVTREIVVDTRSLYINIRGKAGSQQNTQ